MRLIDADKLECVSATMPKDASKDYKEGYGDGMNYVLEIVDDLPTIIISRGEEHKMDGLIDKAKTIRAWCKLTCGVKPEECGMTFERDGAEECNFVEFLWNRPKYDCTHCYLWEEDEDE